MPKKCAAVGCRSGYAPKIKKGKHEETETSDAEIGDEKTSDATAGNKVPVFGFPDPIKKRGLRKKWINFVKREDWVPTVYSGICREHFDPKYIRGGKKRSTLVLHLDPVPTIYTK